MSRKKPKIGVLGLQGAFQKHIEILERLGVQTVLVKYPEEITGLTGIIIPGGESTTMTKLIAEMAFREQLINFRGGIFGTCAGAIMLAREHGDSRIAPLNRVPIGVVRNAYGRQIDSFTAEINLTYDPQPFPAVFIRAPKLKVLEQQVTVLGKLNDEIVLVKYNRDLVATFHPELTSDTRIHEYFVRMLSE